MRSLKVIRTFFCLSAALGYAFVNLWAASLSSEIDSLLNPKSEKPENKGAKGAVIKYTAAGYRDPFQGYIESELSRVVKKEVNPAQPAESLPSLYINGIVCGAKTRQAVINNKVVMNGDKIDRVEISDISREGVKVLFNGREYFIPSPASGYNRPDKIKGERE